MVVAYCSFCPKMPQKASKRGLLAQKGGGLLEFQSSGGLIKSGLLFARIPGEGGGGKVVCKFKIYFYYCECNSTTQERPRKCP